AVGCSQLIHFQLPVVPEVLAHVAGHASAPSPAPSAGESRKAGLPTDPQQPGQTQGSYASAGQLPAGRKAESPLGPLWRAESVHKSHSPPSCLTDFSGPPEKHVEKYHAPEWRHDHQSQFA